MVDQLIYAIICYESSWDPDADNQRWHLVAVFATRFAAEWFLANQKVYFTSDPFYRTDKNGNEYRVEPKIELVVTTMRSLTTNDHVYWG